MRKSLIQRFNSDLPNYKPGRVKVLTIIDTHFESKLPNPTKLARVGSIDIRTVNRTIEDLKLEEILPPYE